MKIIEERINEKINQIKIETDFCTVLITKGGQLNPNIGNEIYVVVSVQEPKKSTRLKFNKMVFGKNLNCRTWMIKDGEANGSYLSFYINNEANINETGKPKNFDFCKAFISATYSDAFKEAKNYAISEIESYYKLVSERETALENAE